MLKQSKHFKVNFKFLDLEERFTYSFPILNAIFVALFHDTRMLIRKYTETLSLTSEFHYLPVAEQSPHTSMPAFDFVRDMMN